MRVTNKMTSDKMLANLISNQAKMDKTNNMLASGKRINIPQDDPTGTIRAIGYRSNLSEIEQYAKNVNASRTFLENTDSALGQLGKVLHRIRELTVEAANDTYEQNSRDAIADEIGQLTDEVVGILNAKVGNRYIFGGFNTIEEPFKKFFGSDDSSVNGKGPNLTHIDGSIRENINSDNITGIKYNGDGGKLNMEIDEGVLSSYNISGEELINSTAGNLFDILINLRDTIYSGNVDGMEEGLGKIDVIHNQTLRYISEVGAKMNRMENISQRLSDKEISVTELLSKIEDTDVTKTLVDFNVQESVQRMALAVGARVIQPTLMDFIR
ncbi:MAG: flagellar hook-associated protein FlgL [Fusobacteria bacterium]|jgi:flagellar hook-associated protein 3 FlgL|nr:flagellar hook-associated protein FlgL [Fusobacteriota bacterium]